MGGPSAALAFGQAYAWDNGLTVTVGRPVELAAQPSTTSSGDAPAEAPAPEETAPPDGPAPTGAAPTATAPADAGAVVTVDVALVNGTDRPVNTSIYVAMTSGGADAPLVEDPEAGLTGPPGTMIQPGQDVSFTMGFEVQDPGDLTMEVRPAYQYVSALFVHPASAQG